ncbi:helix-turn-helix transcriptional regulator [Nannocystis sp. SCPEA4]|jgi:DNA-binding XRE family transcriptional regulator|uniref:helix-turn-helix transcriptional regulator n=1 Tax=Nannocystis sp. SCPEA4 TaxID=2996787 RepID=UPI0022700D91|nr:helix-turn-helix transcriptional regulator [Nannocystis sp. SCPEA4]MCY1056071.1 helix-turn-helix transcriptional regulator [Nannocystis sp. SCPEA4]
MTATPKQELQAPPPQQAAPADTAELYTRDDAAPRERDEDGADDEHAAANVVPEAPTPKRNRKAAANETGTAKAKGGVQPNNVRKLRQAAMMSKAELARRAGVSPLTIDRVESGCPCRMDTKRKILEALGLSPSAREQVFGPDIDQG